MKALALILILATLGHHAHSETGGQFFIAPPSTLIGRNISDIFPHEATMAAPKDVNFLSYPTYRYELRWSSSWRLPPLWTSSANESRRVYALRDASSGTQLVIFSTDASGVVESVFVRPQRLEVNTMLFALGHRFPLLRDLIPRKVDDVIQTAYASAMMRISGYKPNFCLLCAGELGRQILNEDPGLIHAQDLQIIYIKRRSCPSFS